MFVAVVHVVVAYGKQIGGVQLPVDTGKYGISAQTAREYMRMYRNTNHLPPKTSKPRDYGLAKAKVIPEAAKLDEYQKMSKEDLISALIDARIREERLKLGYEVVEEDDSKKKLITYVKKTAK